jgi:hypothetical protein
MALWTRIHHKRPTLKHRYFLTSLFCNRGSDDDDDDPTCHINDKNYVCSKEIAKDKLDETRFVILKWSLVATLWFLFFLRFFVIQGIIFVFTKLPLSYIFLNVLRHVDTPTTSLKNVALTSLHTYVPFMLFDDLAQTIWDSELLRPEWWAHLEDLKWILFVSYIPTLVWLVLTVLHVARERTFSSS